MSWGHAGARRRPRRPTSGNIQFRRLQLQSSSKSSQLQLQTPPISVPPTQLPTPNCTSKIHSFCAIRSIPMRTLHTHSQHLRGGAALAHRAVGHLKEEGAAGRQGMLAPLQADCARALMLAGPAAAPGTGMGCGRSLYAQCAASPYSATSCMDDVRIWTSIGTPAGPVARQRAGLSQQNSTRNSLHDKRAVCAGRTNHTMIPWMHNSIPPGETASTAACERISCRPIVTWKCAKGLSCEP